MNKQKNPLLMEHIETLRPPLLFSPGSSTSGSGLALRPSPGLSCLLLYMQLTCLEHLLRAVYGVAQSWTRLK